MTTRKAGGVTVAAAKAAQAVAETTFAALRGMHPDAHCELDHTNAFQLVVATVLSAQTTDVAVNKVTPGLFAKYPDAKSLAAAEPTDVQPLIDRIGMFRQKAKNIVGLARILVEKHGGEVPQSLPELVELPGVGRKTANVVLGVMWQKPEGVVVDTHVQRISQRLGWTRKTKPEDIEQELCKLFPREDWDPLSHTLIFHGRRVCFARKPECDRCAVKDVCPSAGEGAASIGRKPSRGPRPPAKKASAKPPKELAAKAPAKTAAKTPAKKRSSTPTARSR